MRRRTPGRTGKNRGVYLVNACTEDIETLSLRNVWAKRVFAFDSRTKTVQAFLTQPDKDGVSAGAFPAEHGSGHALVGTRRKGVNGHDASENFKAGLVVEWFDERQCYHMPSLTRAANGNLLPYGTAGFCSGTETRWAAMRKTGFRF